MISIENVIKIQSVLIQRYVLMRLLLMEAGLEGSTIKNEK
jgi:hypothetical protein